MSEVKNLPKPLARALIDAGVPNYKLGKIVKKGAGGGIGSAVLGPVGGLVGAKNSDKLMGFIKDPMGRLVKKQGGVGFESSADVEAYKKDLALQRERSSEIYQQQKTLAEALAAQARGEGPNLALQQLRQTTGQNVAGQLAMQAAQRGASANPALMARQAANIGAGVQQQAVGQGAVMQAQQQMAAQQALAAQQAQMQQQAMAAQGMNISGMQGFDQARAQNAAMNAQINAQNIAGRNQMVGQLLGAGASALTMGMGAGGGAMMAGGALKRPTDTYGANSGGRNVYGQDVMMVADGGKIPFNTALLNGGKVPGKASKKGDSIENDVHPALLSPGEIVIPRSVAMAADAPEKSKKFVEKIKGLGDRASKTKSYQKVVNAKLNVDNYAFGGQQLDDSVDAPMKQDHLSSLFAPSDVLMAQQSNPMAMQAPAPEVQMPDTAIDLMDRNKKAFDLENQNYLAQAGGVADYGPDVMVEEQPQMAEPSLMSEPKKEKGMLTADDDLYGYAKAARDLAKSKGEQLEAEAKQAEAYADSVQKLQAKTDEKFEKIALEQEELVSQFKNKEIDPDQAWSNRTTGQKIGTIAAILLGGLGAGMTGKANLALEEFNRQRDLDIEAQKANLGKTQSLLSINMQRLGDLRAAQTATRLQMDAIFEAKLKSAAAKTGSKSLMAEADLKAKEMRLKMAPERLKYAEFLAKKEEKEKLIKSGNEAAMLNLIDKDGDRSKAAEELGKVQKYKQTLGSIRNAFKEAGTIKFVDLAKGQNRSTMGGINAQINAAVREAFKNNPKGEDVENLIGPYLINPTDDTDEMTKKLVKIEDILKQQTDLQTVVLDSYGIPVKKELPGKPQDFVGKVVGEQRSAYEREKALRKAEGRLK